MLLSGVNWGVGRWCESLDIKVNLMQGSKLKNILRLVNIPMTILVVFLASCGPSMKTYKLYEGPQLPSNETAQLVCEGETIQINSVNGQKSPKGKDTFGNVTLEILPGDYNLIVSFSGRSMKMASGGLYTYNIFYRHDSLEKLELSFKAEAGHIYLLTSDHNYEKERWHAVIKDETADKKILKEGPYPLNKIRTGDNRATRYRGKD